MIAIICGGRKQRLGLGNRGWLDHFHLNTPITELVNGKARGIDEDAEIWAVGWKIPVTPFPADWDDISVPGAVVRRRRDGSLYNANAGPMRNQQMADYVRAHGGGVCIAFPGGSGTADMICRAKAAGLTVYDLRGEDTIVIPGDPVPVVDPVSVPAPTLREIYTDGGVIGRNPSQIGGTWAWCRVHDGVIVDSKSGCLFADEGLPVSNNNTELYALCAAILALPDDWYGRVNSDSKIAIGWVFQGWQTTQIPEYLLPMLAEAAGKARRLRLAVRLLAGHPNREDLKAGLRLSKAPNLPVSEWNVWCDKECTRLGKEARTAMEGAQ